MNGYVTLDCRDGAHAGCAVCDCDCHRPAEPITPVIETGDPES